MAISVGRKLKIKRDDTLIASVRTKSVSIGNEPIDITTDDEEGFRKLLEESAQKQIDLSVEGLLKDNSLVAVVAGGTDLIEATEIEFPDGAKITGDFRLNNIELGGEYNGSITFSSELHSSGAYTYTA